MTSPMRRWRLGRSMTTLFVEACVEAARHLRDNGTIVEVFGRPIPVLVHAVDLPTNAARVGVNLQHIRRLVAERHIPTSSGAPAPLRSRRDRRVTRTDRVRRRGPARIVDGPTFNGDLRRDGGERAPSTREAAARRLRVAHEALDRQRPAPHHEVGFGCELLVGAQKRLDGSRSRIGPSWPRASNQRSPFDARGFGRCRPKTFVARPAGRATSGGAS